MSQIIRCDSCGRQLGFEQDRKYRISVKYIVDYNHDVEMSDDVYDYNGMDFCGDCMRLFNEFLAMSTEEKMNLLKGEIILPLGEAKPIEKPKRKYTKRQHSEKQTETTGQQESNRKVDEGKVMALYKAGGKWDYNYIADEMGTDADTIRMIVMKHQHRAKAAEPEE